MIGLRLEKCGSGEEEKEVLSVRAQRSGLVVDLLFKIFLDSEYLISLTRSRWGSFTRKRSGNKG
jgi:hypothetical protein